MTLRKPGPRILGVGVVLTLMLGTIPAILESQTATRTAAQPRSIEVALQLYGRNEQNLRGFLAEMETALERWGVDARLMLPSLVPELLQQDFVAEFVQSEAMRLTYVQFGSGVLDFSLGPCQIKLSSAERLEAEATRIPMPPALRRQLVLLGTPEEVRLSRFKRLMQVEGCALYLAALYYAVVHLHSRHLANLSQGDKIWFFAAAYNAGYHFPVETIRETAMLYRWRYDGIPWQFGYADLALAWSLSSYVHPKK